MKAKFHMKMFDVSKIYPFLWQGSKPPHGNLIAKKGFDVLILAAFENQKSNLYHDVHIINAPGIDSEDPLILEIQLDLWKNAADEAVEHIRAGKNVLVTCIAGLNRSGFISALILHKLTGWNGQVCVDYIRSKRESALINDTFVNWLVKNL